MKFMQRAVASASSAGTPSSDERSSKRRRVDNNMSPSGSAQDLVDQAAIRAALKDQEDKRLAALEKHAADRGDSHWVLQNPLIPRATAQTTPLNVVFVGYADIDASDVSDGEVRVAQNGRKKTDNYKKEDQKSVWGQLHTSRLDPC